MDDTPHRPEKNGDTSASPRDQGTVRSPLEGLMAAVTVRRRHDIIDSAYRDDASRTKNAAIRGEQRKLNQVIEVATAVAQELNEQAIAPDLSVERPWVERRPKLLKKFDRTPKVKLEVGTRGSRPTVRRRARETVLAEGWLLARGAKASSSGAVVQEVMLGTDGKLHVYTPEGDYDSSALMRRPTSRCAMQTASARNSMPAGGLSQVAQDIHAGGKGYYQMNTGPATEKFVTLQQAADTSELEIDGAPVFADAHVIEQGLQDLVIEMGVTPTDTTT